MVYHKNKWKEIPRKKKINLIGISCVVFIEIFFLGMLAADHYPLNFDDLVMEYVTKPIGYLLFNEDITLSLIEPDNILNHCDVFLLNQYSPKEAKELMDNGLSEFCEPSKHVQSLLDSIK